MKWMQFVTPVKSLDYNQTSQFIHDHPAEDFVLLDVRQPSEYGAGHIPGARLIPLPELADRLSELDPEKPVLVY